MRLLLAAFVAIATPSRRPSMQMHLGHNDDTSGGAEGDSGRLAASLAKKGSAAGRAAAPSECGAARSDAVLAKPMSVVLTHTTADFDSLASAVGLALVRKALALKVGAETA
jgi:hypothetical protein